MSTAIDGFSVFGPFSDPEDVADWAESELKNETWWAVEVESP